MLKMKRMKKLVVLSTVLLCLFQLACQNKKSETRNIDFVTTTSGDLDFGKTNAEAYTPEIRSNMEKLYEDKFGMFVHWGPYAQLEGIWDSKKVAISKNQFRKVEVI